MMLDRYASALGESDLAAIDASEADEAVEFNDFAASTRKKYGAG